MDGTRIISFIYTIFIMVYLITNAQALMAGISVYYSNSYTDPQKSNWNAIMDIQDIPFMLKTCWKLQ